MIGSNPGTYASMSESSTQAQPPQKRMTRAQAKLSENNLPIHDSRHQVSLSIRASTNKPRPRLKKMPFPFLLLPVETRIQIYHDALTYDHILIRKQKARQAANLLLVNRLIHSEAFTIFYDVNVFQVHIGNLPSDTETQIANVHYMRQCCLHLEITMEGKTTILRKLVDKFVADIWSGKMECLLVDIWEPEKWSAGTQCLEKFTWVSQIHLVQVVVNQVGKKGVVKRRQDRWCQRLERSMMAGRLWANKMFKDKYEANPILGIDLVGDELETARLNGGWVVKENDLYVLFGKC
ncbi:MAG: hypothetical protein Q9188_004101 [Gyalolechia gomerana]